MVFSSLIFLCLFLPLTLILYLCSKTINAKNNVLVVMSLIFYAWGEPKFVLVMIGWVLFYYTDFAALLRHLGAMFGLGGVTFIDPRAVAVLRKYTLYPLLAFLMSLPVIPALDRKLSSRFGKCSVYTGFKTFLSASLLFLSVLFLVGQTYNPFIYFRF